MTTTKTLSAHHNARLGWYVLTSQADMWKPSAETRKAIEVAGFVGVEDEVLEEPPGSV